MNKIILLALSVSFFVDTNAQAAKTVTSLAKLDLGLQGIGFSYEAKAFNNFTIDLCAGVGGGYDVYAADDEIPSFPNNYEYSFVKPALHLSLTPKYFYNTQKRTGKGKNTQFNSANFFGIRVKYVTPLSEFDPYHPITTTILTNIHWGIQRTIGGHWLFNSQVGAGYAIGTDCNCGMIYPAFDFKFAYVVREIRKYKKKYI